MTDDMVPEDALPGDSLPDDALPEADRQVLRTLFETALATPDEGAAFDLDKLLATARAAQEDPVGEVEETVVVPPRRTRWQWKVGMVAAAGVLAIGTVAALGQGGGATSSSDTVAIADGGALSEQPAAGGQDTGGGQEAAPAPEVAQAPQAEAPVQQDSGSVANESTAERMVDVTGKDATSTSEAGEETSSEAASVHPLSSGEGCGLPEQVVTAVLEVLPGARVDPLPDCAMGLGARVTSADGVVFDLTLATFTTTAMSNPTNAGGSRQPSEDLATFAAECADSDYYIGYLDGQVKTFAGPASVQIDPVGDEQLDSDLVIQVVAAALDALC